MTITIKSLGQVATSATTETDLYTVPGTTSTVVSSIFVCNRGTTSSKFRISHAVGGGATANKDYLFYDETVPANSTYQFTAGLTLATTDKIKVYAETANLSFNIYGQEIS